MGRLVEGGSGSAEAVDAALARVDMLAQADVPFAHLSAGQRQRVTLARALAQLELACEGTRVLLCDEPVSAMDPRHALEAMSLLRDLAVRKGVAVGVVLHDLSAALRFADDAVALGADGRVLAAGLAAEVLRAEVLERLFGVAFVVVQQPGVRAVVVGEESGTLDAATGQ
jgi:iron complex transport system ATP-binding protein